MAGLTSDRMRRLIEEAREGFDWVIIDTPPVVCCPMESPVAMWTASCSSSRLERHRIPWSSVRSTPSVATASSVSC